MTRPTSYLIRMLVFLAVVLVVAALLSQALLSAFQANPLLNALIVTVLLVGVAASVPAMIVLPFTTNGMDRIQKLFGVFTVYARTLLTGSQPRRR